MLTRVALYFFNKILFVFSCHRLTGAEAALVVRWHQHTCGWLSGWLACLTDTLSSHSCCVDYLLLPSPNLLSPFRFVNCLHTFHIYINASSFSLSRVRSLFYVPPHSFSHSSYSTLSSSLILCRSVFFLHRLRFLFHFSLAHTHTLKKSAALQHIVLKVGKNNKIMTKISLWIFILILLFWLRLGPESQHLSGGRRILCMMTRVIRCVNMTNNLKHTSSQ